MNILNKKAGFTLMEIMVVVVIIGILSAAGVPYYKDHLERQKAAIGITDLKIIADSMERYTTLHPTLPEDFNFRKLDADIDFSKLNDTNTEYNNGYFTFTIETDYIRGHRNTGEYDLRFILDDNSEDYGYCCFGQDNVCTNKLKLPACTQ